LGVGEIGWIKGDFYRQAAPPQRIANKPAASMSRVSLNTNSLFAAPQIEKTIQSRFQTGSSI